MKSPDFSKVRIVVVGDIMLDSYTEGRIERLSAEAPVPVVVDEAHRSVLGGAGNVARNAAALGAKTMLVGLVGNDREGEIIRRLCQEAGIDSSNIITDLSRSTTVKNRIIVNHHQVLRVDAESCEPATATVQKKLRAALKTIDADIVIFSDYIKGVIDKNLVVFAMKRFGALNTLADFKPAHAEYYRGIGYIFPNLKEAYELTGIEARTKQLAKQTALTLAKRFKSSVVLKRSEYGTTLCTKTKQQVVHIPTQARQVFDVTGAGDTVIAVTGVALGAHMPFIQAAKLANHAAGIVVEMEGTAAPDITVLMERFGS